MTVPLARSTLVDVLTASMAVGSLVVLLRYRLNTTWLVLAGVVVGLLSTPLR